MIKKIFLIIVLIVLVSMITSCGAKEKAAAPVAKETPQEQKPAEIPPVAETPPEEQVPPEETETPIVTEPGLPPSSKGLVEFYIVSDAGQKRDMLYLNQQSTYLINGKEYVLKAEFIGVSGGENKVIFSVNGAKKEALGVKGELFIDGKRLYVKSIMVK